MNLNLFTVFCYRNIELLLNVVKFYKGQLLFFPQNDMYLTEKKQFENFDWHLIWGGDNPSQPSLQLGTVSPRPPVATPMQIIKRNKYHTSAFRLHSCHQRGKQEYSLFSTLFQRLFSRKVFVWYLFHFVKVRCICNVKAWFCVIFSPYLQNAYECAL